MLSDGFNGVGITQLLEQRIFNPTIRGAAPIASFIKASQISFAYWT
jgi:hypothetical protein